MRLAVPILVVLVAACSPEGAPATFITVPLAPTPLADARGTEDAVCVDVDGHVIAGRDDGDPVVEVRSGDVVAGNFAVVVGSWSSFDRGRARISWIPGDPDLARTTTLEVRIEALADGAVHVETFAAAGYAEAEGGAFYYWPTDIPFPAPGRYRLTAAAPGHEGCFELTV